MKKMKKILAMLLALTMVLGMGLTSMAATAPKASDKAPAVVEGVESGASVYAYQIVKGTYNDNGLTGYEKADSELVGAYNVTVTGPTYAEVMAIADGINKPAITFDPSAVEEMTWDADNSTYTADLTTGYWIVLVRGTGATLYNPMVIGVNYVVKEGDNELVANTVSAADHWTLTGGKVVAKKSTTTITKDADVETQDSGDVVNYTVETKIPDYSAEYKNVKFDVTDTLTNLTLKSNSIKVYAGTKAEVEANTAKLLDSTAYTLSNVTNTTFKVEFVNTWILANVKEDITIKYSATLDNAAIEVIPGENRVEVEYSNNPNTSTAKDDDEENVYAFKLDVLEKVNEKNETLDGATFTVYTDQTCTTPYTNSQFNGTVTSANGGKMVVNGLAEGTYYVKETNAPAGYTLNTTVYTIVIDATIENEELKSWTITTTYVENGQTKSVVNTYTVGTTTNEQQEAVVTATRNGQNIQIKNTSLINLPSTGGIGTTIFTVAGCGIMIAAAFFFFASRKKEN